MKKDEISLIPVKVEEIVEEQPGQVVPYGIQMVNAPAVWGSADRGRGVIVAVLDTGVQVDHPDLVGRVIDGRNFTSDYGGDPNQYSDNHFHGTHVCGTIAAVDNKIGVVGMAPEVKILALKVLNSQGQGSIQNISNAIEYAIQWRGPNGERVRVISMSLGGPRDVPELHDAIKQAVHNDILVVAAAGNAGDGDPSTPERGYPGFYDEVVEVGAVDKHKQLASFSDVNREMDLVAPGVNVLSTYPGGKYAKLSGTSMATPHVSGAAALVINLFEKKEGRPPAKSELFAELMKQVMPLDYSRKQVGNGLLYLTASESGDKTYRIAVKPLADGYTVQVGFDSEKEKAEALAEQLRNDLSQVSGVRAEIETYHLVSDSSQK